MLPDLSIFPHQVHSLYFLRWYYSHAVLLYAVNPRIRGDLSLNLALKNLFSRLTAGPGRQSPSVQPQQRQVRRFQPFSHRLRFSSTEIMRGLNIFSTSNQVSNNKLQNGTLYRNRYAHNWLLASFLTIFSRVIFPRTTFPKPHSFVIGFSYATNFHLEYNNWLFELYNYLYNEASNRS